MTKHEPLIRSTTALRGLATGLTALSLAAMASFASAHFVNPSAPLAAGASAPAAAPVAETTRGTSRGFVAPTITRSTRSPLTRTRVS